MPDVLDLLIQERDKLNRAIEALGGTIPKRRGRPPGSGKKASAKAAQKAPAKKRRRVSTVQRKAVSERMKKYWAARREAAKKSA